MKLIIRRLIVASILLTLIIVSDQITFAQSPYPNAIQSIAWSPNGQYLAIGKGYDFCDNNDLSVYDIDVVSTTNGQTVGSFHGHTCSVTSLEWNPNGDRLISTGADGTTRLWEVTFDNGAITGAIINVFGSNNALDSKSVSWNSNGNYFLSVSNNQVIIWENLTGTINGVLYDDTLNNQIIMRQSAADWSPNDSNIVTGNMDGSISSWDVATGELISTTPGHPEKVLSLKWDNTGTYFATGSLDGTLNIWDGTKVWDTSLGQPLATIQTYSAIQDISWHPDGNKLASAQTDGTVKVWDGTTGENIQTLPYSGPVLAVAWNPTRNELAYGGLYDSSSNAVIILSPIANAGSDQIILDTDNSGTEIVTLDGSASDDMDGTIVSYDWSEGGTSIAIGVSPQVGLTVGLHTITLTVTDNDGATGVDEVIVTVEAPTATPTSTNTPTLVPTDTPTPSATNTLAPTDTPTVTPTSTLTLTPTSTPVVACDATVVSGDVTGLISAIDSANNTPEADTICLEAGTYTLAAVNHSSNGDNGLPQITTDITLVGLDAGAAGAKKKR